MGAAETLTDPSSLCESNYMGNGDLSDTDMVITVRNTLASVQNGECYRYDELVKTMQATKNSDLEAQLVVVFLFLSTRVFSSSSLFSLSVFFFLVWQTALKALSSSVAYLDIIHHEKLLSLVFRMSLWDLKPHVMDALVGLLISLAVTTGKYLDPCLNMLVRHFLPPDWVIRRLSQHRVVKQKMEVLSHVHEALLKICILFPRAPSRILDMLPKINKKGQVVEIFVENLLKLENSLMGQDDGSKIFMMVMERLRDMDLEIDWDGIPQDDSSRGLFDMELEDAVEDNTMKEGDEFQVGSLTSDGNVIFESLDKLMVLSFDHLESCKLAGRLDQVFEKLFEAFEHYIMDIHKTKVSQFLMFYACSLDPENCGVKFAIKLMDIFLFSNKLPTRMSAMAYLASYLARGKFLHVSYVASILKRLVDECADHCRTCSDDINSKAHQIFYSGCQAIMYVLCFRMRSILAVPRFRSELIPLESILMHKLNPLKECLPWVVAEFLKQAKAGGLFVVSDSFIFDKLLESELSRGSKRLDAFFPFDPCLLKSSNSFISGNFIYWSMVRPTYDEDDEEDVEIIVNVDEESDEEEEGDVDHVMDKMSITPKHYFMNEMEREKLLKMPSVIRPSISPQSL
ncbi:RNA polymerase I-specific transcription initiation factor RRN3 isoform X2 [Brassica rapa]|uniref:RNA polymerase I-specific transcription initiation factor RRN3 isoform X2 n=1 Tax=Brassica campestris TaxID=3711 RepID=UPI00142DE925|nr:RNA polymerase I-specific transcription initiation factor RRN3 isoform X2 [Brassica rapa]